MGLCTLASLADLHRFVLASSWYSDFPTGIYPARAGGGGTSVSPSAHQEGQRPGESDVGRWDSNRPRGFSIRVDGLGPKGTAARAPGPVEKSSTLPRLFLLSSSPPAVPTPPYLPRAPRLTFPARGTRSTAGARPLQAVARRDSLSLRLPPPETLLGSAPETASASGGASTIERCAHAGSRSGRGVRSGRRGVRACAVRAGANPDELKTRRQDRYHGSTLPSSQKVEAAWRPSMPVMDGSTHCGVYVQWRSIQLEKKGNSGTGFNTLR
ncbi:uncharacterized protein LOC124964793 [Sciurus carolinensis]|uniref:uncharacterized protein LOC124964793 n=1 Tax=Sciurus carolinensis TaxID=30640 RepID=UPI001FB2A199|nr:uncharacterized protein LOC124964793 [Sciurus carolinensis]